MREIPIIENVLRMKHAEEMLSFWLVVQESTKRVLELAKNTMH